ncbi:MAG: DegQ family serine endoprotease [Alphaproteobacteria bacterium]|nr:DegQ family serine endoprotease [Alphaproteobacteria bacterium]
MTKTQNAFRYSFARVGRLAAPMALLLALALAVPAPAFARGAPDSFAELADKLLPAVVNVSTTQVVQGREQGLPDMPQFPPGSPFEDFFKDFFGQQNGHGGKPQKRKATSLGSGFIIDRRSNGDTYVVTNNHVIQDADEVSVILQDDTRMKAEIVGRDPKTDIAVLKVHTDRKLPSVRFGDSQKSRVGDWVVAIGNPFGLGGTVTAGIISARGRDINAGPYDDFIQTDASINRGNSGGPMFNMDGEVIGINTAIYSPSGGSVGIGFAIPASAAEPVIDQLIKHGQVTRGWLGVHIQAVTESIAETLGLKKTEGALVSSVVDGGPAAKGGVKSSDVILQFDRQTVTDVRKLQRIVAATPVEKTVDVKVWRDGAETTVQVTVGRFEDDEQVADAGDTPQGKGSDELTLSELGLVLAEPTGEVLERFDLPEGAEGVIITDVDTDGTAYTEGLRAGDVVAEVNQARVKTPADVVKLVQEAKKAGKRSVLLLVEGQNGFRFVAPRLK